MEASKEEKRENIGMPLIPIIDSTAQRAALKRCAGRPMSECTSALGAYFTLKPKSVPKYREEIHFAVTCLSCLWKDDERGQRLPFAECLRRIRNDSLDHRMVALLDSEWDNLWDEKREYDSGLFQAKLSRLARLIKSKASGFSPDFEELYRDLCCWDSSTRYVQKKWARLYFAAQLDAETQNQDEKNDEDNQDIDEEAN